MKDPNISKQMKELAYELKKAEKNLESAIKAFNRECEKHDINPKFIIENPREINAVMTKFDKSKQFANFVRKFVDYNEALTKVDEVRKRVSEINPEAIAKEIDNIVSPQPVPQVETAQ